MADLLTLANAHAGLYVHEAGILGNLYVQKITERGTVLDRQMVFTTYLQPVRPVFPKSYYLEGPYTLRRLSIIEDPVAFIQKNWLTGQARYIMEHDVDGLGQRMYQACAWMCADAIINRWKRKEIGKVTLDNKRWLVIEYTSPDGIKLQERRGWCRSDGMFNGKVVWGVVAPDGTVEELGGLVDCIRKVGLWFDDSRYLAAAQA